MPEPEKVTDEQANEALRALIAPEPEADAPVQLELEPEVPAEPANAEAPAPEAAEVPAAPEETDDVVSLKKRLEDEHSQHDAKVKAMQERYQQNERIVRERFLRKATVADKALKVLKATRTEQGVPEADVDRAIQEIEGTMNPASTSYSPPPSTSEDQAMILNDFLNENGMTTADAEEFGKWIRNEGGTTLSQREQELAGRDLDGFLRVAHLRYGQAKPKLTTTREAAVEAVRTVQRTQREAARAATATPSAPRKATVPPTQRVDTRKLTHDDISALLRQSVEENR